MNNIFIELPLSIDNKVQTQKLIINMRPMTFTEYEAWCDKVRNQISNIISKGRQVIYLGSILLPPYVSGTTAVVGAASTTATTGRGSTATATRGRGAGR